MIWPRARTSGATCDDGRTLAEDLLAVLRGERHGRSPAVADAAAGGRARMDHQRVGAHAGDRLLDGDLRALADLHHGDHRATPMITPKAVKAERILFRRSAVKAVRRVRGKNADRLRPRGGAATAIAVERAAGAAGSVGRGLPAGGFGTEPVAAVVGFDLPVADVDRPMGIRGHLGIVRHQDHRDPLGVELLEHPQDLDARCASRGCRSARRPGRARAG